MGRVEEMSRGADENLYREFGALVRERRKGKGLTVEQVGQLCGVTRSQITGIECGYHGPSMRTGLMLAGVLSIDLNRLRPKVEFTGVTIDWEFEKEGKK